MANLYKHIFISGNVKTEKYKIKGTPVTPKPSPKRNRADHSAILLKKFDALWAERQDSNQQREAEQIPTKEGTYLSFSSQGNCDLITKSLESIRGKDCSKWIRLLNIKTSTDQLNNEVTVATIYVPRGQEGYFVQKIKDYQDKNTGTDRPPNAPLVNSIEDVSLAFLESFWTDNVQLIPNENGKWCEVWLNVNTNEQREQEQIAVFKSTLENIDIEYKPSSIIFPERAVLLIHANRNQLIELMLQSDLLAEFRAGQEPAGFWVNESVIEQQGWVENLLQRIEVTNSLVKVCVLDTGVNNGHQLLQPLLDDTNTLTVNPDWETNDHGNGSGHGTLMAGVAAYGKLEEALTSINNIVLTHQLCSVKILSPPNKEATPKELWGDITAQGISRAEIQNPGMTLIYCMAVTSTDGANLGRPSSRSGAIDNLVFGYGENQKLIII